MAKAKKTLYTQQGYDELKAELERRQTVDRERIKNDIATARSFGDLSENSEYDEARNEQAKNETRILELKELLENAEIIDESTVDTKVVSLGSTVAVTMKIDGKDAKKVFNIVGSNEADPAGGKISDLSPIGAALIGKREGDKTDVDTPNGKITITVGKVTRK